MRRLLRFWRAGKADLALLWFALRHPARPGWLWPATGLLAIYAFEPLNFALPVLGVLDDFVILPLVLHALLSCLPAKVKSDARSGGGNLA